jgi:aldose 1-epimerase
VTKPLRIVCGESECLLLPHNGGSIGQWNVRGQAMLRRGVSDHDPLGTASFPLVPYSNRIANAQFPWAGEAVSLRSHPIAAPHAIHGVGWQRPWDVTHMSGDRACLSLHHDADDDWPWPFHAEQSVSVGPDWLLIDMTVQSCADQLVPLAFGHHLYFDNSSANLRFSAECIYPVGSDDLPQDPAALDRTSDFSTGLPVQGSALDNCFGGWDGRAEIRWDDREFAVQIEADMPNAVVYTPCGSDYFCFEPVPHISNALSRADGNMPQVAPGQSFAASIHLRAVATG